MFREPIDMLIPAMALVAVLFVTVMITGPQTVDEPFVETELTVWSVSELNGSQPIVVQYLDGDELKTIVLDPTASTTHIYMTGEDAPRLIRNDTLGLVPSGMIREEPGVVQTDWHLYIQGGEA